jgi:hypothetical protein
MWTTDGVAFSAPSPSVWTIRPQETEQYGHVLRGLRGARDLQLAHLRTRRPEVETQRDGRAERGGLEELATGELHRLAP